MTFGNRTQKERKKRGYRIQFRRMQWAMLLFFLMIAVLLIERRNIVY